jgi:hypothetical protein
MKKEFMRIGGAKTEKEFYEMYPTEEEFLKKHGRAVNKLLAQGGEAYPQTATMNNFMSFGVGHTQLPMLMEDGGYMPEEQTLPKMGINGKLLEFVGIIKNTAANNINKNLSKYGVTKNPEQYDFEQAKWGGNLKEYQTQTTSGNTTSNVSADVPPSIVYNYYYGPGQQPNSAQSSSTQSTNNQQNPYNNDIDYLYRRRPLSDFNIRGRGSFGNYSSTGWLKDEYGLKGLREMGMTDMYESNPRWWQLLKRPTKSYHFGQQGQQPLGYVPGQVNQQGMPITNQQGPASSTTSGTPSAAATTTNQTTTNQSDPGKDMGFLARMFYKKGNITAQKADITNNATDRNVPAPQMVSKYNPQAYNIAKGELWNQINQNKRGRIAQKLNELEGHKEWQKDLLAKQYDLLPDTSSLKKDYTRDEFIQPGEQLYGRKARRETRLMDRMAKSNKKFGMTGLAEGGTATPPCPPGYVWKGGQCVKQSRKERKENPQFDKSYVGETYQPPVRVNEEYYRENVPVEPIPTVRESIGNQPVGHTTILPIEPSYDPIGLRESYYPKDVYEARYPTEMPTRQWTGVPQYEDDVLNFDSNNTEHRAAMMRSIISGATDDEYDNLLPGTKNKKYGGSYNTGDVVDMTPEELQRFIAMGGQVEFLD